MEYEEALGLALQGRAILFAGAGFAYGALDLQGKEFTFSAGLANALASEAGFPDGLSLEDAGDLYVGKFGESQLLERLRTWYSAGSITTSHRQLASIPWRKVYTTNYDDIFETACAAVGKRVDSFTAMDAVIEPDGKVLQCIHLNGYVKRATPNSISREIKLTGRSYATGASMDDEWTTRFRFDLHAAQAIFFVGYSMPDLDLKRVLLESELAEKSFFILGKSPDPATSFRANTYGLLVAAGIDEFADKIESFSKNYSIPKSTTPIEHCVKSYFPVAPPSTGLEDRFVFDLMLYGRLREEYLAPSLLGESLYCLPRQSVVKISNAITAGTSIVFLHSGLGNGKTVAMQELKYMLFAKGIEVFSVADRGETFEEELHVLLASNRHKAVFIDSYTEWLDILPLFRPYISLNVTLIMAARSSSHDALQLRVLRDLGNPTNDKHFDLDQLGSDDIEWVSRFFDAYGFWGDEAFANELDKKSFLMKKCEGQWQGLLVKIFQSPQIFERLQKLFTTFARDSAYREPVIRIAMLTALAYQPNSAALVSLAGDEILLGGFRRDAAVQELIEFSRDGGLHMRSSVIAEALLKKVADPNQIVKSLIGLIRRADTLANSSNFFFELFKNLVRFSSFHLFFSEKERGKAAMQVYETVKSLDHCARSPLFWLQYAIAALVGGDFARSGTYFDTAYSFANGMDRYDSFQIDNHYARFLLERAVASGDRTTAMETFRKAKALLAPQFQDEWRHYPYRVAIGYYDFFSAFSSNLHESELEEIGRAAENLIEKINHLPYERAGHRSVRDCLKAQQRIIEKLEEWSA